MTGIPTEGGRGWKTIIIGNLRWVITTSHREGGQGPRTVGAMEADTLPKIDLMREAIRPRRDMETIEVFLLGMGNMDRERDSMAREMGNTLRETGNMVRGTLNYLLETVNIPLVIPPEILLGTGIEAGHLMVEEEEELKIPQGTMAAGAGLLMIQIILLLIISMGKETTTTIILIIISTLLVEEEDPMSLLPMANSLIKEEGVR